MPLQNYMIAHKEKKYFHPQKHIAHSIKISRGFLFWCNASINCTCDTVWVTVEPEWGWSISNHSEAQRVMTRVRDLFGRLCTVLYIAFMTTFSILICMFSYFVILNLESWECWVITDNQPRYFFLSFGVLLQLGVLDARSNLLKLPTDLNLILKGCEQNRY